MSVPGIRTGESGAAPQVLVLGIGNILWADEGFGVRCVEAMAERYRFGDNELVFVEGDSVATTYPFYVYDHGYSTLSLLCI